MQPYQLLFEKVLSRTDPEKAHHAAFRAIRAARPATGLVSRRHRGRSTRVMGLDFPGVLGLAAGFDKNGVGIDALANLGFGFVEIGTVTGEPQPGNPRPRLARLTADRAVVNRMGFNNDGAEAVARRLAARRLDRTGRRAGGAARHQHRQDQGGARGVRRPRLREEHHPAHAVRRLPGRQRLLTEHAGAARPPGGREARAAPRRRARAGPTTSPTATSRCWSRSPPTSATTTCSPSPTSRPRSGWTASWPPTRRSRGTASPARPSRSRRPAPAGSPADRCVPGPPRCSGSCATGSVRTWCSSGSAGSARPRTPPSAWRPAPTCCRATPRSSTRARGGPPGSTPRSPAQPAQRQETR